MNVTPGLVSYFWIEGLKEYTFETEFVALSVADARGMVRVIKEKRGETVVLEGREALDEIIQRFGVAFVKLSSRSPKDATVVGERTRKCYQEEIAKVKVWGLFFCGGVFTVFSTA